MVDPISNAPNLRENNASQNRPQSLAALPGAPDPGSNLAPDQRVGAVQAAVEKLIRKSLPDNSKLQIEQDKETGTFIYRTVDKDTGQVIHQWPAEELVKLREYLAQMEGMLVDKQV